MFTGKDRLLGGDEDYAVSFCQRCQLGITDITVNDNYLNKAYPEEYYNRILRLNQVPKDVSFQLDLVLQHVELEGKKVLEIGCADGSLLTLIRQHGAMVFGVEPSSYAAHLAKDRDLRIYKDFSQVDEVDFDVIILFDVLEHMDNPVKQISAMKNRLRKGGIIIMVFPNFASIEARILREKWFGLELPRHLSHFTPKSVELLAAKSGLRFGKIIYPKTSFLYNSFFDERLREKPKMINKIRGLKRIFRLLEKLMYVLGNKAYMVICFHDQNQLYDGWNLP